jgi:hypothetical protein
MQPSPDGQTAMSAASAPAARSAARLRQRELMEMEAYGVAFVSISSDEDPLRCPRCAPLRGVILRLSAAPHLPIPDCKSGCTCQLTPLSLE